MASVPRDVEVGQQAPAVPTTPDRVAFVLFEETADAFRDLEEVAADGLRAPSRRKLTKAEARAKYERACSALAWLLSATTPAVPQHGPAGSEGWCL